MWLSVRGPFTYSRHRLCESSQFYVSTDLERPAPPAAYQYLGYQTSFVIEEIYTASRELREIRAAPYFVRNSLIQGLIHGPEFQRQIMPKIKAVLTVEFEADSSDQEIIDLALDQVLILQPSCKVTSKTIAEIDGEVVNQQSPFSLDSTPSSCPRHQSSGRQNGVHGSSYRPEYSDRDRDRRIDSYRPGSLDVQSTSRPIDSYKPRDYTSNPGKVSSDAQRGILSPDMFDHRTTVDGDVPSAGPSGLGTRFDALIGSMVFRPPSYHFGSEKRSSRLDHYSPQPRPGRSASPSRRLRQSDRLRAVSGEEIMRFPDRARKTGSDFTRKASFDETHESGRWERKQQRKEDERQIGAEPGSLEALAPNIVAKDLAAGGRNKFEKQRESKYTLLLSWIWSNSCSRKILKIQFSVLWQV
jgi:hypothetical protein